MNRRQESLLLIALCAVLIALSAGGAVWTVASGVLFDIDGLMLLLTCLAMGGVFSLLLFLQLRALKRPREESGGSAEKPAKK